MQIIEEKKYNIYFWIVRVFKKKLEYKIIEHMNAFFIKKYNFYL